MTGLKAEGMSVEGQQRPVSRVPPLEAAVLLRTASFFPSFSRHNIFESAELRI